MERVYDYGSAVAELRKVLTAVYVDAGSLSDTGGGELRCLTLDVLQALYRQGYTEVSPYILEDVENAYTYGVELCNMLAKQLHPDHMEMQEQDAHLLLQLYQQHDRPWTLQRLVGWYRYLRTLSQIPCKIHPTNAWWKLLRLVAEQNHTQWLDSDSRGRCWVDYHIVKTTADHRAPHSHTVVGKISRLPGLLIPHVDAIYTETGSLSLAGNSLVAHMTLHYYILIAAYADRHAANGGVTGPLYAAVNSAMCQFVDSIAVWREHHAKTTRS